MQKEKIAQNILLITTSNFPYGTANSNTIRLLSTGLVKNNRFIKILLQNISKNYCGIFEGVEYQGCGIFNRSNRIVNYLFTIIVGIFSPIRYILKNHKEIDLIITFNNYFYESALVVIFSKYFKIPVVHHQVDIYDWQSYKKNYNIISREIKYINYLLRYWYLNRFNEGIIVISSYLFKHFKKIRKSEKNIYLLTHLVQLENFKEVIAKPIFVNNESTFGALGPLNEANGISDLIRGFEILLRRKKNIRLMLIGGPEDSVIYYKTLAKELNIENNIVFTGPIHHTKLSEQFSKCDAFVLARPVSVYAIAGFPTKVGEFLATQRPMIITKYGDIPTYFKDEFNALLAEPSSPKSIAEKMSFIIECPEKAKGIGMNGYYWALKNLEYISITKKLIQFLDSLVRK